MTDQQSTPTRRSVLKAGGLTAGAAVAGSLLPPSVHRAMAQPAPKGGLAALRHAIFLMQENRSFDHYYGTLRGVRGYGDPSPLRRRTGSDVLHQPRSGGADVPPFSLREAAADAGRAPTDIQYLGDLPHGFTDATGAWADGWWDAWIANKTAACMTYYDRSDVPLQYELAETFTILDAYHCSVFGSTNPNRNYFWSGKVGYEPGSQQRAVTNAAYGYAHAGYDWTTYPERLEAAGVSWRIYQEWDNFTDNAVEYFKPFKRIGTAILAHVEGTFRTTEEFYDSLHGKSPAEQDRLLAQLDAGVAALTAADRALFEKAMYRSRPGTLVQRIADDIAAGTLPRVVWVVPPAALSEHPGVSTPVGSANLVYDLLDLVASDLDLWGHTATFINFDENDGYFDHVPPPIPPRPEGEGSIGGDDWDGDRPIGLGPRVPMTIVSPWTIGGYVDSTVADHTSTLRFLERWTGVAEPQISSWRRAVCSDLLHAFDFKRTHRPEALTQPDPIPVAISRWRPAPPAVGAVPDQEPGRRPARAARTAPRASLAQRAGTLIVTLGNGASAGAAASYTVYPFGTTAGRPSFVTVSPGGRERASLTVGEAWDVVIQGPERFWYEASGRADGSAARIDVRVETSGHGNDVDLVLVNDGDDDARLVVRPLRYRGAQRRIRLRAGATRTAGWPTDRGWFDIEVTADSDADFRRRVTGRVATGREGISG